MAGYVQSTKGASSPIALTGVSAGNLLVFLVSAGGDVTAVTSSLDGAFAKVPNDQALTGVPIYGAMWYLVTTTAGTHSVSVTGGFGGFESYGLAEYNLNGQVSPLDKYTGAAHLSSLGQDPDSGTASATAQADELLVGMIACHDTNDYSDNWLNGFTNRQSTFGDSSRFLTLADLVVSATGTYAAQASTDGTTGETLALIATFKIASGVLSTDGKIIFQAR